MFQGAKKQVQAAWAHPVSDRVQWRVRGPVVEPELAGRDVAYRVGGVGVDDHLRVSGGAGGEVAHQRVARQVVRVWETRGGRLQKVLVAVRSGGLSHHDDPLERRAVVGHGGELVEVLEIGEGDPGPGEVDPVRDVLRRQQCGPRHGDDLRPDASEYELPPLHDAREDDHGAVAGLQAQACQDVGHSLRALAELPEGDLP